MDNNITQFPERVTNPPYYPGGVYTLRNEIYAVEIHHRQRSKIGRRKEKS